MRYWLAAEHVTVRHHGATTAAAIIVDRLLGGGIVAAAVGAAFQLRYLEDCRRLRVGNVTEQHPSGRPIRIGPAEIHRAGHADGQRHGAGEEDDNVIDVIRFRDVDQELTVADLLEIGLNLRAKWEKCEMKHIH